MGEGLLRTNNQQERKTKKILGIGLVIGVVNVNAIISDETYTYLNIPEEFYTLQSMIKIKNGNLANGWKEVSEVSLPFDCPNDGFMTAIVNPIGSSNLAVLYVSKMDSMGDSRYCGTVVSVSGTIYQMMLPVQKGKTYKVAYSSYINDTRFTYYLF